MKKRKTRSQKIKTTERLANQRLGFVVSAETLNSISAKKKVKVIVNKDNHFRKDLTKTLITTAIAVIIELVLWRNFSSLF